MAETAILERPIAVQRGRRLEYFTIIWNALEGLVAVVTGVIAGSISLMGFGLDSFIEVVSGSVLLWRMSVDADAARRERNERLALRVVGICFLLLAAYIAYESVSDLLSKRAPERSLPGIILACVSLVGRALGSAAMHADAKQNRVLHVLVGHPAGGAAAQCSPRSMVGRSRGRARDGSDHRERGNRRIARQGLRGMLRAVTPVWRFFRTGGPKMLREMDAPG